MNDLSYIKGLEDVEKSENVEWQGLPVEPKLTRGVVFAGTSTGKRMWWPTPDSDGRPWLSRVHIQGIECDLEADESVKGNGEWCATIHSPMVGSFRTPSVDSRSAAADWAVQVFKLIIVNE